MRSYSNRNSRKKGIRRHLLWGTALAIALWWGTCNYNKVGDLETQVENKDSSIVKLQGDSAYYSTLADLLDGVLTHTSDSLKKTDSLYKESVIKNKDLTKQIRVLRGRVSKLEKALKISENLEDERFQELLTSVKEKYTNAINDSMSLDSAKYADLEAKYNSLYDLYNDLYEKEGLQESIEQNINSFSPAKEDKKDISFEVKHRNALYDLFVDVPRFKAVGPKSFIFRNDNPEETEAWVYFTKTGRLIGLKNLEYSSEYASFSHPYFGDYEGPFEVYANDKGEEKTSPKKTLYVYDGVIYTKEKLIPEDKIQK